MKTENPRIFVVVIIFECTKKKGPEIHEQKRLFKPS